MPIRFINYIRVQLVDEKTFDNCSEPTLMLDDLLRTAGTCEADTILEIGREDKESVIPLYKWNVERDCWQMLA